MKQILLFLIIFRQNDCLPKIDDVHVHLNMSEIQKGVVGGNKMNPSPEFEHHGIDYDREAEGRTFTYNCGGVSTSCDNNGKCQIRCNNGRKYEVTCPNKGTITSISNSNGRSQISCGKKVKFPPCFPFCDDNSPIGPQDPNTCGVSRPCQDCNNFECNQAAAKCKWQIQRMLEAHNSGIFYAPGTCTTRMDMNQKECHMVNSEYECKFKYAAKCKWEKESPDVRWSPGTCTKRIDRNQKECDKVYNEYECNQAAKCKWETKGWFPLCKNKTIVSNQRECDKVYNEHECNKEAKCKWERMMYWSAYPGECTKTIVSNQRECNIEYNKKTECSSHGCFRKRVGKTRTVEECKNTCKEREQCGNFIWHKPGNDRWAQYDCYVLEGFKWEKLGNRDVSVKKDRNTITGTCKKGSNCIVANIYYHGNDIDRLEYIQSAQDCACECKKNRRCKFFSWVENKKICWLKTAITSMGADGSINEFRWKRKMEIHGINIGQTGGVNINNGDSPNINVGGNTHTLGRGRTQQYGVYSGSRDCCEEHDDNCPEKNKNYGNGHGLQIRWNVQSWEACSDLCSRRSDCQYWTWHHDRAGKYSYLCKTMAMREYEREDRNCVSGTRACKGASHGQCELDRNTAYFTAYDNVSEPDRQRSLSECIKSCKSKRYCKFFSYHHATGECYYKTRKSGSVYFSIGYTSGSRDCYETMNHHHAPWLPPGEKV